MDPALIAALAGAAGIAVSKMLDVVILSPGRLSTSEAAFRQDLLARITILEAQVASCEERARLFLLALERAKITIPQRSN